MSSMGDEKVPQSSIDINVMEPPTTRIAIDRPKVEAAASGSLGLLARFHAGYFRISLSFWAQFLLWKTLSNEQIIGTPAIHNILEGSKAFVLLWWLSLCTLILLSVLYILRAIFHFRLVKAEFRHYVGLNYLFTPWTSCLLLVIQAAPLGQVNRSPYQILCWLFLTPVLIMDIKTYGQWITTERRFLSLLANPTNHLSVMGNFVGAWAAARMGWRESAVCIFSLGLTHYLVVFVTLFQRLAGASRFPVALRPVFFLFVAAPSTGSLAWSSINSGSFETPCKLLFFLALFLFTSLICRPVLFKKSMRRFNISWWAYSFSISFLALASAAYAEEVNGFVATGLMLILSALSLLVFLLLMLITALNTDRLLRENDPACLGYTGTIDHKITK